MIALDPMFFRMGSFKAVGQLWGLKWGLQWQSLRVLNVHDPIWCPLGTFREAGRQPRF